MILNKSLLRYINHFDSINFAYFITLIDFIYILTQQQLQHITKTKQNKTVELVSRGMI